jgi:hypothetical protein
MPTIRGRKSDTCEAKELAEPGAADAFATSDTLDAAGLAEPGAVQGRRFGMALRDATPARRLEPMKHCENVMHRMQNELWIDRSSGDRKWLEQERERERERESERRMLRERFFRELSETGASVPKLVFHDLFWGPER